MPLYSRLNNKVINFNYSSSNEVNKEFKIHYHNIFEVYYFIEGDVDYLVEGKQYHPTPYSLLLLSPHVFHGVRVNSDKNYQRYVLHFHPEIIHIDYRHLLLSAFPNTQKYSNREVYYENTSQFKLHPFFEALSDCSKQPEEIAFKLFPIYIEALLSQLTIMCRTLQPVETGRTISNTMSNIITYLNDNLSERITLDGLSEHFFISKNYLNRAFREATGTTVFDYLIYKRVIYAQQLLLNGYPASEASLRSGFSDYSSFYRAYQKITGHSPHKDMRN